MRCYAAQVLSGNSGTILIAKGVFFMEFCSACNNLLLERFTGVSMELRCSRCPLVIPVTRPLVRELVFVEEKKASAVHVEQKMSITCVKCGHDQATFVEMQTRSADEASTIFLTCSACQHKWKLG